MAKTFAYTARERTGRIVAGTIVAEDSKAVAEFIQKKGYFVTRITEEKEPITVEGFFRNFQKISLKDMAILCRQFSTMMDAGLSLIAALNILIEQTENVKLKNALQVVLKRVQEGHAMSEAMTEFPDIFPTIMVAMVESGEVGGVLDEVMDRLATQFEKDYKMNEKVKSAMTYPIVVISMSILVVIFILTQVLPTFLGMFKNMNMELPFLTKMLLALSDGLKSYGLFLVPILVLIVVGYQQGLKNPQFRLSVDVIKLKLPVFGMLWRKVAIARFTRTLGTLLRGGVPLIAALDVVKKTTDNLSMTGALSKAQDSVREGHGLSVQLKQNKDLFPPMVIQMISVGEETGDLDRLLGKVADFYDDEVEDMVNRLSTLLEPLLIGFLGIVIGTIILSIMIPMFDVISHPVQ